MADGLQRLIKLNSERRFLLVLAIDAVIASISFVTALLLRFNTEEAGRFYDRLPQILLLLVGSRLTLNVAFKLHRWSFKLSGLTDGARVVMASLAGTALFVLVLHFTSPGLAAEIGRAVLALELLISASLMAALRFAPRLSLMYRAELRGRRSEAVPTVIVGAGSAGELLLRGLQRSEDHRFQVVGFIDDDSSKHGHVVGGKTVVGGVVDLPRLAERLGLRQVLIAIPRLPARRIREILEICDHLTLRFKILPFAYSDLQEQPASAQLQDLTLEDLLYRDEVKFEQGQESSFLDGGSQMVVGAAGSIGSEVCAQLLGAGARRLVMVDIDENGLYLLKRRLERRHPDRVVIAELGDVRDARRIEALFDQHRPVDVFHAAARKQVPLMESAPGEAVKTNVLGTLNLVRAAAAVGCERFVYTSTDKAVRPVNVMGATKRLGEMLIQSVGASSQTRFMAVRFGNVLGSAGSVVPLFKEQIEAGGPVTVTHPEARRYFMTISEAVGLVLRAAYAGYGRLCVLEMGEQIQIARLARLMITMSGRAPDVDVKIAYMGLRPGEKLSEELLGDGESVVGRIDSRIQVVDGPPPEDGLLAKISQLQAAVAAEDQDEVRRGLRELVPAYRPYLPSSNDDSWASASSTSAAVM